MGSWGVWQSGSGLSVHCAVFNSSQISCSSSSNFNSKSIVCAANITQIYFDARALSSLGYKIAALENYEKPYIRLVDCLLQYPDSDLSRQIFAAFFDNFTERQTFRSDNNLIFDSCLDFKHVEPNRTDNGQDEAISGKDQTDNGLDDLRQPGPDEEEVEDCLDVKIKINFDSDVELSASGDDNTEDFHADELDLLDASKAEVPRLRTERRKATGGGGGSSMRSSRRRRDGGGINTNPASEIDSDGGEEAKESSSSSRKRALPHHRPTLSERRLLSICKDLGKATDMLLYFSPPDLDAGSILCRLCKKVFTCTGRVRGSLRISLTDQVVEHVLQEHFNVQDYSCQSCGQSFADVMSWKKHTKRTCRINLPPPATSTTATPIGRFICKKCRARHTDPAALRDHVVFTHDPFSADTLLCPTCGLMFKNEKCRGDHERRMHNKVATFSPKKKDIRDRNLPNGGAARVVCPTCGFECCTKWVLETHIKKWHENAFPQPKVCELCVKPDSSNFSRRKYHTPYSLDKHRSEYHGEECHSIICEHCSEVFKGGVNQAKRSLRAHIDKVHLGIKHECDECEKQFITEKTLSSHKRHVHRKEGKYPCKACGKVFGYYLQAVEHAYKDRGEAPHQCKFCDFKSAHSWALAKHRPVCKRGLPRENSIKPQLLPDFGEPKFAVRDFLHHRLNM